MASETESSADGSPWADSYAGGDKHSGGNDDDDSNVDSQEGDPNHSWIKTPLFVTKTYEMINECDPEVAAWTDDGEMFIVKDQAALSSNYIPQYFGHSNFSSFDRQLNFYGFRKSYPDSLRQLSNKGGAKDNLKHVKFYHEYFKRGRTDLFHLIKRARSKKGPSKKSNLMKRKRSEVDELKDEVASLESRLSSVSSRIESKFAQLSRDISEKMAAMRAIVYEASDRVPKRPISASGHAPSSQGGSSLGYSVIASGEIEESHPPRLDAFNSTQTPFSPDDFTLEGPLNVTQPIGGIGRISSLDVYMSISPFLLNPPGSRIGRTTTMEEYIALVN